MIDLPVGIFAQRTNRYFMKKSAATRLTILQKAFELIYMKGYQATSIDEIIATTDVTKGAFYYHFKNKDEMGLAVINEIMFPSMHEAFVAGLSTADDPVNDIYGLIKMLLIDHPLLLVQYGCPAGNLTQEMSPLDEQFNTTLRKLVGDWQQIIIKNISNGQQAGKVRKDVVPEQVAYFVMSGYWGIRNFGKLYNSKDVYNLYLKELKAYLQTLQ